jgi:eukaryotic-like serine/threonine-protein kinase
MKITLTVTAGPHAGRAFAFDQHDTFLVGRGEDVHFRLPDDPTLSRKHFLLEVNPPLCRLQDLGSRGGTKVNGAKVTTADLADGDRIDAGGTGFRVQIDRHGDTDPDATRDPATMNQPVSQWPTGPLFPPVPGYTIRREVGRGGMGAVYEAVRTSDGATVALKTLTPAVAPTRLAIERFLREARILKELTHPHIVAFRDMGEVHRLLWFAMEFVPGRDAAAHVKADGPLPPGQACRLGLQLLDALVYAHAKKFVHRDIKPHNLLLTRGEGGRPAVKLSDFGLARTYQASQLSGLTVAGESGGTPLYMPPEQWVNFRDVQPPADQYSAAATLYFLVSGQPVYNPGGTAMEMMLRVMHDEPVPLRTRRPEVPEGLAAVIHRALARKPEQRYADVRAFAKALAPFAGSSV